MPLRRIFIENIFRLTQTSFVHVTAQDQSINVIENDYSWNLFLTSHLEFIGKIYSGDGDSKSNYC